MPVNAIKEKRISLGLTQKDFADALGLGKNGDRTLRRWENGESHPSHIELKTIIDFASETPFEHKEKRTTLSNLLTFLPESEELEYLSNKQVENVFLHQSGISSHKRLIV